MEEAVAAAAIRAEPELRLPNEAGAPAAARPSSSAGELHEVPEIAVKVLEDGDGAVIVGGGLA